MFGAFYTNNTYSQSGLMAIKISLNQTVKEITNFYVLILCTKQTFSETVLSNPKAIARHQKKWQNL